jgi:2-methylcitrate dehydratase PrpD
VDAALRLIEEYHIEPENIDQVVVHVAGLAADGSFPLERWRKPTSTLDAKFSVPFSVAVALAKRRLGIREFMPEGLTDPAVLQMAAKITALHEPEFETKGTAPGQVDIKTRDGREYSKKVVHPRGSPENRARDEEVFAKFKECASFSAKPLSESTADEVIDMVMNLEKMPDVGKIMRLLTGS